MPQPFRLLRLTASSNLLVALRSPLPSPSARRRQLAETRLVLRSFADQFPTFWIWASELQFRLD
jgi:hypothetical protein